MAFNEMDRLVNTLQIRLPGAVGPAINLELFNTIDEFFRKTNSWRYEIDVNLSQGATQYPIFPPAGTSLVRVMTATHNGRPLVGANTGGTAVTQRGRLTADVLALDEDATYFADETVTNGAVLEYSVFYPTYVTVSIPPSADATQFPIKFQLAITLSGDQLQDEPQDWSLEPWMYDMFHEAWMDGTSARLMSQINKPYTSIPLASYHAKRFRNSIAKHRVQTQQGLIFNPRPWRFPRGWA